MENTLQKAIDSLTEVMNIHENHIFPKELTVIQHAFKILLKLQREGFK